VNQLGPGAIWSHFDDRRVGATAAMIYDMSTGRATFGDVVRDIGMFIEGWFVEIFTHGAFDAELEKTHAYALFLLLLPGIPLLWLNLIHSSAVAASFASAQVSR
jgi:hypothetical protein